MTVLRKIHCFPGHPLTPAYISRIPEWGSGLNRHTRDNIFETQPVADRPARWKAHS